MKPLKPSEAKDFVVDALMCNKIPYLSGPPGIGKSDTMEQVANEFNLKLLDIRLSQMLPEDLTGLPSMTEDKIGGKVIRKARYIEFDTFPMENDIVPDGYDGWLIFLDELSSASEEVMAAIYSLLLGRRIGGKKIHKRARIVAAGNRASDSAIARELPDTLITRMLPREMTVNTKDWINWASLPETNSNQTVVDFITKYPDMLLGTVDHSARSELETYPTPRGWGTVFDIVNLHEKRVKEKNKNKRAVDSSGIPTDKPVSAGEPIPRNIMHLMSASVGELAAQSFREHYDSAMQLPYPWDVAQSPTSTKIPSTSIGRAQLTSDLAEYFLKSPEQTRDNLLQFMNRMDKEHSALFTQLITEKVGSTVSDTRLVEDIKKRLSVDDLMLPTNSAPKDADEEDGEEIPL